MMRAWQLGELVEDDPIPTKLEHLTSNRRELDWRPVWEWSKRHPNIHLKEIAKALGREQKYVYRKLGELDKK